MKDYRSMGAAQMAAELREMAELAPTPALQECYQRAAALLGDAQGTRDAWCEGDTPPAVKPGHEREFVVAVRRAHSGKVYSFAASYLNAAPLRYDYCPKDKDGFCEECSDDGCPTTGWFIQTGDDDGTQYNRLHLDKGDEFMGWREIPRWEDRASLPEGSRGTVDLDADMAEHGFYRDALIEECAKIAENCFGGKAHTYTSENADLYRSQDATCELIAAKIRALSLSSTQSEGHSASPVEDCSDQARNDRLFELDQPYDAETTDGWNPISTAPKDGPAFLVWVPENKCIYEVIARDSNLSIFGGGFRDNLWRATHWMPLPTPPSHPSTERASGDANG